jgi:hypothetical protein
VNALADTLVLAKRGLLRIPRQPDLLIGFTIQPVMFVLLFVYVFGGAIQTPGYDYVDFLMPGIITQSIAFGGFVTALGLSDDLKKGLIDRFRSLPMSRAAVLAGRTLADLATNTLSLIVLVTVGVIVGFSFHNGVGEVIAGFALLLLFGYAFSWVFACIGLVEAARGLHDRAGLTGDRDADAAALDHRLVVRHRRECGSGLLGGGRIGHVDLDPDPSHLVLELVGRPVGDHAAGVDHGDPVGEPVGFV